MLGVFIAGITLPAVAHGREMIRFSATFHPERLGHGTTIGFRIKVEGENGSVPPPLTEVNLLYPNELGIGLSGLGIATCTAAIIEAAGADGCPTDSRMGFGSALAEIRFGPETISERARVSIFRAPTENGHIALLLSAEGAEPVQATINLSALLLPADSPFGGSVDFHLPLIPSLPEASYVSVVELQADLGPEHLTYYERIGRRTIAYVPRGILLPDVCPPRGFLFASTLAFIEGNHTTVRTTIPCPRARHHPRL